jgi:hypothetical protein
MKPISMSLLRKLPCPLTFAITAFEPVWSSDRIMVNCFLVGTFDPLSVNLRANLRGSVRPFNTQLWLYVIVAVTSSRDSGTDYGGRHRIVSPGLSGKKSQGKGKVPEVTWRSVAQNRPEEKYFLYLRQQTGRDCVVWNITSESPKTDNQKFFFAI